MKYNGLLLLILFLHGCASSVSNKAPTDNEENDEENGNENKDDTEAGDTNCANPPDLEAFTASTYGEGELCKVGCQDGLQICSDGVLECATNDELPAEGQPGFLSEPAALQLFHDVVYAKAADEYLLTYPGSGPLATRISACGMVLEEHQLDDLAPASHSISAVSAAYNPDRQEYLLLFRYELAGDPAEVYGRFFDLWLQPLAPSFPIRSSAPYGNGFSATYSHSSQRFLIRWSYGHDQAMYQMVEADSSLSPSLLGTPTILAGDGTSGSGMKSQVSYSRTDDTFLAVYAEQQPSGNESNVYGRYISGDGESIGNPFPIATTNLDETGPRLAYAPSSQHWLVIWQHRRSDLTGYEVEGAMVDALGNVTESTILVSSGPDLWDAPGPVTYVVQHDQFLMSWFVDGTTHLKTVDPHTQAVGEVIASFDDAVPMAATSRALGTEAQALLMWTQVNIGVYAGFVSW